MKRRLVVMVGLCLAPPAMAAYGPPTTVMMGTAPSISSTGINGYHCSANAGPASFQRGPILVGAPIPPAIISVPGVAASGPGVPPPGVIGNRGVANQAVSSPAVASYTGVLFLKFTSAKGGTIGFDYNQGTVNSVLPSGNTAPFNNYSQVWNAGAGTLKVSFNIVFPNCTLPLVTMFRTVQ
jgi:hypothetical protein